jgi:hypothetical protein
MTPQWFVARFVRDLRRGEQQNIGVILFQGGKFFARFLGEAPDAPEAIDGRRIRGVGAAHENYKAWVHFWRQTASRGNMEKLLSRRAGDNYFVEAGGRQIAGHQTEPAVLLHELYSELVSPSEPSELTPTPAEVSVKSDFASIFRAVGEQFSVRSDFTLELADDSLFFEYAVEAHETFLFSTVTLNGNPMRTWKAVHSAVYSVEAAQEARRPAYALVTESDPGPEAGKQMRRLENRLKGNVIKTESPELQAERIVAMISAPQLRLR